MREIGLRVGIGLIFLSSQYRKNLFTPHLYLSFELRLILFEISAWLRLSRCDSDRNLGCLVFMYMVEYDNFDMIPMWMEECEMTKGLANEVRQERVWCVFVLHDPCRYQCAFNSSIHHWWEDGHWFTDQRR